MKIMGYFSHVRDIATFKRTLHCVMRAERSVRAFHRRNKPRNPLIAIIRRLRRKLCVISHPFEIIRRLNALFHCIMRAERSARVVRRRNKPRYRQNAFIRRFWRILRVISLPFEIFRRLNALCTALCMQNVVHACPPTSKQAQTHANCNNLSISSKIMRYFSPVGDISTFKRSFHCIMRAERSALVFRRRNNPRHTQYAIIRRFCRKLSDISLPFEIFRRLNALCTALCMQNLVQALSIVETSPDTRKLQ